MDLDLTGRGVLFDKDGTLFDFTASWAAASARILHELADGDDARLARMAQAGGFDLQEHRFLPSSVIIAGTAGELYDVFAEAGGLPHAHVRSVIDTTVAEAEMVKVAGIDAALAALRAAGARLGVVTNDSAEAAVLHLRASGLEAYFDTIVGYDSGYMPKPAPGSCLGAAAELDLAPSACVMVGDSTHDLEAGAAAGMVPLAVLTGIAQTHTLAPLANAVLPSAAEVPHWFSQSDPYGAPSGKTTTNVAFDT